MIAMVVWHAISSGAKIEAHEQALIAYGNSIEEKAIVSYDYTANFRSVAVPWLDSDGRVYESWYVMNHSAALTEMLNHIDTAMTSDIQTELHTSHEEIIDHSTTESAGLYRLRSGALEIKEARYIYWLDKSHQTRVGEFLEGFLAELDNSSCSLWSRVAGLSAGPQFAIFTRSALNLPSGFDALEIALQPFT